MSVIREVQIDATEANVQYPLSTDGDSIYAKDINVSASDNGNFSGSVLDYFTNLKTINIDSTSDNPKTIKIWFYRTVYSHKIGFGCDDMDKNFGTDITIKLLGSGEEIRYEENFTLSAATNSYLAEFGPKAFNGVQIEFNTSDEVCLSNLTIQKSIEANSTIHGLKDNGDIGEVGLTNKGQFKVSVEEYGDTPSIDSFARLRVSNPFTLFDSKQLHDKQPLFWSETSGGDATSVYVSADSCVRMRVTANADDYVIRQTKQRFNYQPGKSQLIFMTFYSPQSDGATCRIGGFDGTGTNNLTPNNGIFFECDGGVSWNIAKNGVITESVPQSAWNVDKLDGTGPSEVNLTSSAAQILVIDYEWLGVGRVRVGFVIDGLIVYCHYFNHANNPDFSSVYMRTPNLPLRYSIQTDGSTSATMDHICSTVISEGGQQETGILRSVDTGTTHVDADDANTTYAVVGIRLKSLYKDITVLPEFFSMINETEDDFRWSLHLNPTIDGTFNYEDVSDSAVQKAVGATANTVSDDGSLIDSGYVVAGFNAGGAINRKFVTSLRMGSSINGDRDTIVLCVTPLTAGADIHASLTFRELL